MTFGNYVLFNLLVAILVEGFSSEVTSIVIQLFIANGFLLRGAAVAAAAGAGAGAQTKRAQRAPPCTQRALVGLFGRNGLENPLKRRMHYL